MNRSSPLQSLCALATAWVLSLTLLSAVSAQTPPPPYGEFPLADDGDAPGRHMDDSN